MLRFKKKVSSFGKKRRIIEVPRDYYNIIKLGDVVIIEANENKKEEKNGRHDRI